MREHGRVCEANGFSYAGVLEHHRLLSNTNYGNVRRSRPLGKLFPRVFPFYEDSTVSRIKIYKIIAN